MQAVVLLRPASRLQDSRAVANGLCSCNATAATAPPIHDTGAVQQLQKPKSLFSSLIPALIDLLQDLHVLLISARACLLGPYSSIYTARSLSFSFSSA